MFQPPLLRRSVLLHVALFHNSGFYLLTVLPSLATSLKLRRDGVLHRRQGLHGLSDMLRGRVLLR